MYVCVCKAVKDKEINQYLESGLCNSVKDISKTCEAGRQCGRCVPEIRRLVNEYHSQNEIFDLNLAHQVA
jgi:bacterioferritin-associated ferredoxin